VRLNSKLKRYERKKKKIYTKMRRFFTNCKHFNITEYDKKFMLRAEYLLKPEEVEFIYDYDEDFKHLEKDLKFVYEDLRTCDNIEPQELELNIRHHHRIVLSFYLDKEL
jgi:hypothetical protein